MPRISIVSSRKGFTLLELIITTALLAIMVVIVSGALRLGIRAWEKGERKTVEIRSPEIILELVRRQIASILPYQSDKEGNSPPLFAGEAYRLEFISLTALSPELRGSVVHVIYRIEENDNKGVKLAFFEESLLRFNYNEKPIDDKSRDWNELAGQLNDMIFEYAVRVEKKDELIWQSGWPLAGQKGMPEAVKIIMKTGKHTPPLSIIIPIHAQG